MRKNAQNKTTFIVYRFRNTIYFFEDFIMSAIISHFDFKVKIFKRLLKNIPIFSGSFAPLQPVMLRRQQMLHTKTILCKQFLLIQVWLYQSSSILDQTFR